MDEDEKLSVNKTRGPIEREEALLKAFKKSLRHLYDGLTVGGFLAEGIKVLTSAKVLLSSEDYEKVLDVFISLLEEKEYWIKKLKKEGVYVE